MLSEKQQGEVMARIRAEFDPSLSWRENYLKMYPEQVSADDYLDCLNAVNEGAADAEPQAGE